MDRIDKALNEMKALVLEHIRIPGNVIGGVGGYDREHLINLLFNPLPYRNTDLVRIRRRWENGPELNALKLADFHGDYHWIARKLIGIMVMEYNIRSDIERTFAVNTGRGKSEEEVIEGLKEFCMPVERKRDEK